MGNRGRSNSGQIQDCVLHQHGPFLTASRDRHDPQETAGNWAFYGGHDGGQNAVLIERGEKVQLRAVLGLLSLLLAGRMLGGAGAAP